jgi:CRISPR/Cas system-associated endonuclease Cas3-HD
MPFDNERTEDEAYALREADGVADEVQTPPIRCAITYAVALHEIGNILGRYQRSRKRMVVERWA